VLVRQSKSYTESPYYYPLYPLFSRKKSGMITRRVEEALLELLAGAYVVALIVL